MARFLRCNCGCSQQSPSTIGVGLPMVDAFKWRPSTPSDPSTASIVGSYRQAHAALPISAPVFNTLPLVQPPPQTTTVMSQFNSIYQESMLEVCKTQDQSQATLSSLTTTSAAGLPVNAIHGVVPTELRGVFVSNLPFGAGENEIRALFSRVGTIREFWLNINKTTKKSKGSCTIQYDAVEQAQRAIERFNGTNFMNMQLFVRGDRTTRSRTYLPSSTRDQRSSGMPTIVDGSKAFN